MGILDLFPVAGDFSRVEEGGDRATPLVSALHSGNIGDIIYSLPTCRLLGVSHFIINICTDPAFGGRTISERAARALAPLLLAQEGIRRVTLLKSQVPWEYAQPKGLGVDYILDSFRLNFSCPGLHLVYQHALPFNLSVDPAKPWLQVPERTCGLLQPPHPYLAINLTPRYRRFDLSYYEQLLNGVPADRIFFIGTPADQVMRSGLPGTAIEATDFLDLAQFVKNAALFIGNPSFPYALAEGMKAPRLVELPAENNVYPLDGSGDVLHVLGLEASRERIFDALEASTDAGSDSGEVDAPIRRLLSTVRAQSKEQKLRLSDLENQLGVLRAEKQASALNLDALRSETEGLRASLRTLSAEHRLAGDQERLKNELLQRELRETSERMLQERNVFLAQIERMGAELKDVLRRNEKLEDTKARDFTAMEERHQALQQELKLQSLRSQTFELCMLALRESGKS